MLALMLRTDEWIHIGDAAAITLVPVPGQPINVKVGIDAPKEVAIWRTKKDPAETKAATGPTKEESQR